MEKAPLAHLPWDDHLITGQAELDLDNKTLVALLNDLITGIERHVSFQTLQRMLAALQLHFLNHLQREEVMMRNCVAPGMEEHIAKHRLAATQIAIAMEIPNYTDRGQRVATLMRAWILDHIQDDFTLARTISICR